MNAPQWQHFLCTADYVWNQEKEYICLFIDLYSTSQRTFFEKSDGVAHNIYKLLTRFTNWSIKNEKYVVNMDDERTPKFLTYSQLQDSSLKMGRILFRYKDKFKQ